MMSDTAVDNDEDFTPLLENEAYVVVAGATRHGNLFDDGRAKYDEGYLVVNKATEIVEHFCVQLPEAMFVATSLNEALKSKSWEWMINKGEETVDIADALASIEAPVKGH